MKKFLVLAIMALGSRSIHAYDFEVDGIYYNITSYSDLTVEVTWGNQYVITSVNGNTKAYGNRYYGDIIIPKEVSFLGSTYTVTTIGEDAFSAFYAGGSVSSSNESERYSGILSSYISSTRFHTAINSGLTSVTIPETVTCIEKGAFANCTRISAISLPPALREIKSCAFLGCSSITSMTFPNSIKNIGNYVFSFCDSLSSLTLSNSIESIGDAAFSGCSFTKLITPSAVTYIGSNAFPTSLRALIMLPYNPPSGYSGVTSSSTEVIVPLKNKYLSTYSWKSLKLVEMLTPTSREFEYNGQTPTIEWTNNLSGYTMNVSNGTLQKDAGSHSTDVKADFYKGGELDFSVDFPYEYTINKAILNAKVNNASREYGEENPSFNVTYSGFVNGENESVIITEPTISTTATKTSNASTYPITISGGKATNYNLACEEGVLTVTRAPLSAMVNDATKVYGSNNPSFTINYSGLKNGETVPAWTTSPTFRTEATKQSGVGEYDVNAINGVPKNYDLGTITPGTLTVTPAPLTIKANNATRLYYNDNPTFSYTCNGFVNSENNSVLSPAPTLSTTATQSSDTGTYEIKVEGASSPNYSISYQNGTLTVTPRTLMASVGNYSRLYNEENPDFEVLYSGFAGNEDESVLNEAPVASTTATKTSNVGTYTIKVSGGNADNYTFSYTSGTLTINKAEQTISWNQDLSNLNVGDQVELQAKASSGLPITYTIDNNLGEIYYASNKQYLDCLAGGQIIIRAVQNGNNNYYSSPRVSKTVTILGKTVDIVTSNAGYATFYDSNYAYSLPHGLSAQVVTGVDNNKLIYKTIAEGSSGGIIPKGTAVMLASDNKNSNVYTLYTTLNNTQYYGVNLLHGSDESRMTTGSGYHYKLTYGQTGTIWDQVFGWYWGAKDGLPFKIQGNKAWLVIPESATTRSYGFTLDSNAKEITDIDAYDKEKDIYYDIQGRCINMPINKGIYIKNRKKIFIK